MARSETFQLLLTKGDQEAVVAVITRECFPNEVGEVVPPVMVEHEGQEFIFKRRWMDTVFLYAPAKRVPLDDLLNAED